MFEEPDLALDTAPISDEFATLTDHTMAGDDDHDRIVVIGSSDSSDGFRVTDTAGLFLVAARLSIGDHLESAP